jgi:hypothetical protein
MVKITPARLFLFLFALWILYSFFKRVIWYLTELSFSYHENKDLERIITTTCYDAAFGRSAPGVCKTYNDKWNVPIFIRALKPVFEGTHSCMDFPCSDILYSFTNSWIGFTVLAISTLIVVSMLISYIQSLIVFGSTKNFTNTYSIRDRNAIELEMPTFQRRTYEEIKED